MGLERPLKHRVLDYVNSMPRCSISQTIAEVGRYISASKAVRRGRKNQENEYRRKGLSLQGSINSQRQQGIRLSVTQALNKLCTAGKIRRVSYGVYAPMLPKVYKPSRAVDTKAS